MSDLVRRLRDPAFGTETSERNLMNQAADRIAQLEAEIKRLQSLTIAQEMIMRGKDARIEKREAALLNAEKESQYSHFEAHIDRLGDVNREQADRIAQLEAALRPFAEALKGNWSNQQDDMKIVAGPHGSDLRLEFTLADFRRAASSRPPQAARIEQLEAALLAIYGCSAQAHVRRIALAALGEERT